MSMALWWNANFFHRKHPENGFRNLGAFAFYHSNSSFSSKNSTFSIMRRVSKLRWSSSVRWHWGLYTSIAKTSHRAVNRGFVRANCWECISLCRPCKLCCKSQQRSCNLKKEDDNIVASCATKVNNVVGTWSGRKQRSWILKKKITTYLQVV